MSDPSKLLDALERLAKEATPIPGFPDYAITRNGEVLSLGTNWRGYGTRKMQQTMNGKGYLRVRLLANGRRKSQAVHKLVALTFLGRPLPGQQVRHLNGNRLDNSHANLAWGTAKQNAEDRNRHGKTARGERNGAKQPQAREKVSIARRAALAKLGGIGG